MKMCDVNTCNVHISWVSVPSISHIASQLYMHTELLHMYGCMGNGGHSNNTSSLIQCQNAKHVSIYYDGVCCDNVQCDIIRPDLAGVDIALWGWRSKSSLSLLHYVPLLWIFFIPGPPWCGPVGKSGLQLVCLLSLFLCRTKKLVTYWQSPNTSHSVPWKGPFLTMLLLIWATCN